jgi:GNAT superfamily N-acetyltransferase
MPHIRFTVQVDCENEEPSRILPAFHGEIFEYAGDSGQEIKIGRIDCHLVLRGRAMDEDVDLFVAMDSISSSTLECFEALFDPESHEWKESVASLYKYDVPGHDVLLIEAVELDPAYRGKSIGAQVVRETIATLGSSCGLVTCKPFALQYEGWTDEPNDSRQQLPGFEAKRLADFGKVEQFWTGLGFRNLPDSDFYVFAPRLVQQPAPPKSRRVN